VYLIIDKKVLKIDDTFYSKLIDTPVAPKNAFNAAILYSLVFEDRKDTIASQAALAAGKGIYFYHKHREKRYYKHREKRFNKMKGD
jgi:hypothetical protein